MGYHRDLHQRVVVAPGWRMCPFRAVRGSSRCHSDRSASADDWGAAYHIRNCEYIALYCWFSIKSTWVASGSRISFNLKITWSLNYNWPKSRFPVKCNVIISKIFFSRQKRDKILFLLFHVSSWIRFWKDYGRIAIQIGWRIRRRKYSAPGIVSLLECISDRILDPQKLHLIVPRSDWRRQLRIFVTLRVIREGTCLLRLYSHSIWCVSSPDPGTVSGGVRLATGWRVLQIPRIHVRRHLDGCAGCKTRRAQDTTLPS